MKKEQKSKPVRPKNIHIKVIENGKLITNVRVPFFLVKMGMKFGQMEANSKNKERTEDELERLKDVDLEIILDALNSGELLLPYLLVDVDEPDKDKHVTITLE